MKEISPDVECKDTEMECMREKDKKPKRTRRSIESRGEKNIFKNLREKNPKKLKIELPPEPTIPLLGIYPKKTIIQKNTCTPMFTAALFTIARTRKQPKCPSTEEWIKKMWYIYTMEKYSAIKRNEIQSFVETWMDLESGIQSEVSQKEKNII